MNVIAERNLFINTSSVPVGNGRDVSINLPQGYADCQANEQMRMTLSTFLMEKKFYDVNPTNNTFFLVANKINGTLADIISVPIIIDDGNYKSFGGQEVFGTGDTGTSTEKWYNNKGIGYQLLTKIETALGIEWNGLGTGYVSIPAPKTTPIYTAPTGAGAILTRNVVIVTHNSVNGLWTIAINAKALTPISGGNYNFNLYSFELPGGLASPNIVGTITKGSYLFKDTHELLGGCSVNREIGLPSPAVSVDELELLRSMFKRTTVVNDPDKATFEGYFQASLKTLEAVYVRTNLSSLNFQTASFDSGNNLYPFVISSDILAKIPVYAGTVATAQETFYPQYLPPDGATPAELNNVQYGYSDQTFPAEYISFIDQGGHTFSMMLNTNHVSQIRMFLTDDKGRLLPYESKGQEDCNEMYFTATLKVTISKPL